MKDQFDEPQLVASVGGNRFAGGRGILNREIVTLAEDTFGWFGGPDEVE